MCNETFAKISSDETACPSGSLMGKIGGSWQVTTYKPDGVTEIDATEFDVHEIEEQYSLVFVSLEEAIRKNRQDDHGEENGGVWIERETRVMELLMKEMN